MNKTSRTLAARVRYLKDQARQVRLEIIKMIYQANSGHPGGALSATDIVTALYFDVMRIDPANPRWEDRDRFILSKGHGCPVWYACLALKGYFPMQELGTLRKFNSILQGHPDMNKTPGVDFTSGSLGQGLSVGVGMALEGKMRKKDYRVYVVLGDGELDEGQVWEAAMAAAKYSLDNLVAIVDLNRLQMDGTTDQVMPLGSVADKFRAFGWKVMEMDGHDLKQILTTIGAAQKHRGGPVCIVAATVKGKGVSYMENVRAWHGQVPDAGQYQQAVSEIQGAQA